MPDFLLGQPSESGVVGMSRCEEGFFAMQDGRVFAGSVVVKVDLPRTHIQFHAGRKNRMRIGLKVRIREVRNLPRQPMQLDQIGLFNLTQVSPSATFVNSQQRFQFFQGRTVDVQRVWQQLSKRRTSASLIDRVGVTGRLACRGKIAIMLFELENRIAKVCFLC